ncbi:MAG: ATP-binding cassette domain-containing protein [Bacteroides sp.]|nr:ATP-binding cassette domain-containing protein [Roseburia sp.]MCM1345492.1 ATP-binding cassette domain-containing protein [Bacteroides sp.]MCM1420001.1 ATP-binding cassette domain-containing protein [Bacteroides sp.]
MQKIIEIKEGVARHPLYRMRTPVNLEILAGEQIAIVGDNGAGKSMLVDMITEKHPLLITHVNYDFSPRQSKMVSDNIKYITFRDSYGTNDGQYYYQQRWNQHDMEGIPLAGELLDESFRIAERSVATETRLDDSERAALLEERRALRQRLYDMFRLDRLVDKHIVMLSSGELRKFQITRTLLSNPRVLIMDNPFIGLDVDARRQLHELLTVLSEETEITLILVLSKTDDIPSFVTHVIPVDKMDMLPKMTLAEYKRQLGGQPARALDEAKEKAILGLPYAVDADCEAEKGTEHVIDFKDVCIKYGSHTILNNLNFTVMNGERWALSGENGAGKSTLLSIVCADNLQAYANNIVLFGQRRGSGETIWDIKKHIGYISPEMHRAYMKDLPAIEIVASGLSDSVGLYKRPKPEQMGVCEFWMDIFGIKKYRDTTFLKLSSGEQRLVLLARAFVKDPSLLILDEPLHGLDMHNRQLVKDVIEVFCRRRNKTLIMVTHYADELPACIDHSIFLKRMV